jgi:hypothetical protein
VATLGIQSLSKSQVSELAALLAWVGENLTQVRRPAELGR